MKITMKNPNDIPLVFKVGTIIEDDLDVNMITEGGAGIVVAKEQVAAVCVNCD